MNICKMVVYTGLMASGKSAELIKSYYRNTLTENVIKLGILPDVNKSTAITSRDHSLRPIENCITVTEFIKRPLDKDVPLFLYIDEAQFLTTREMRYFLKLSMAKEVNAYVMMTMLPVNFKNEEWEAMAELRRWMNSKDIIFPRDNLIVCHMECEECVKQAETMAPEIYDPRFRFMSDMEVGKYTARLTPQQKEFIPNQATRIIRMNDNQDQISLAKEQYISVCERCAQTILDEMKIEEAIKDRQDDIPIQIVDTNDVDMIVPPEGEPEIQKKDKKK